MGVETRISAKKPWVFFSLARALSLPLLRSQVHSFSRAARLVTGSLGLGHHPFEVAATAILATAMCGSPSLTPQVTLSSVSGAVTNSARLHSADGWEHILWRFALALVWPARRGAAVLIAQIHGQLSLTFERATFRCTLHVDSPTRARHPHIPALVAAF